MRGLGLSKKITPEIINVITNLSRLGHTQHFIANAIGIAPQSLTDWKKKNQKVADALSIGTDGLLSDVKSRLYGVAINGKDRDSIQAGTYLLNKYEDIESTPIIDTTEDAIKQQILAELSDD
jgi:hypothetical protein